MSFECYICANKIRDLDLMVKHLKVVHSIKDNVYSQNIRCVLRKNGGSFCDNKFSTFRAFRAHVSSCIIHNEMKTSNSIESDVETGDFIGSNNTSEHEEISAPFLVAVDKDAEIQMVPSIEFTFGSKKEDESLDQFLNRFIGEIIGIGLNYKNTNAVFDVCQTLLSNMKKFFSNSKDGTNESNGFILNYTIEKLNGVNTQHKRETFYDSCDNFVRPEKRAIGLDWEMKRDKYSLLTLPTAKQRAFEYVPVSKTLINLFSQKHIRETYLKYNTPNDSIDFNQMDKHVCKNGRYVAFCCGDIFKKNELFSKYPNSIQIQLFVDGVELCNPLKPRANVHTQVAMYFSILNMPPQLAYNQNNIHLVAMCYANDLKTKETDYNNLWNEIVKDISFIEKTGIIADTKTTIRGTVANITFDNLGGNVALGFAGGFNSSFFCRICTMSKENCQHASEEDLSKYRTIENYNEALKIVENSYTSDLKTTQGIKHDCKLNELQYFHIINNFNVDIMHDLYEGCIPFLLSNLIEHCVKEHVFSFNDIAAYVENCDYGKLNQHRIPSTLIDKKNVGQNSSQVRSLMLHLPFIFYDFKEHSTVKRLWPSVISMLEIIRIIHASEISEEDLSRLEAAVKEHLESIQMLYGKKLLPKHHFITHYPTIIRRVGPIVHNSTMRYESKHKSFTNYAKVTNNFMDICHYISLRNQHTNSMKEMYKNSITFGKTKKYDQAAFTLHKMLIRDVFRNKIEALETTKWLQINSFRYFKNLFIIHSNSLHEIKEIFVSDDAFYFLCSRYEIIEYDSFLNCIKIREFLPTSYSVIKQLDLKSQKSYEKKRVEFDIFLIVDTLELFGLCSL